MADKVVTADVKSSWASKINWTQVGGLLASLVAFFGLDITAEQLAAALLGMQAVISIATVVLKTWFTSTVTPASASVAGMPERKAPQ